MMQRIFHCPARWLGWVAWLLLLSAQARPSLSFFCELPGEAFLSYCQDEALRETLQDMDASLRVGLVDLSQARAEGIRRLNAAGIPVVAWLLLPEADGYWLNATNGAAALDRYQAFRRWTEEHELIWEGVGINFAPALQDLRSSYDAPITSAWQGYLRLFDDQPLPQAEGQYALLRTRIQDDGYPLESYLLPPILDARQANSHSFQRLGGLPDVPLPLEVPLCYTSLGMLSPAMILSYGDERPAIALGSTGGGPDLGHGQAIPALSWEALSRDLLLAQQVCAQIHLHSLEGCIAQGFLPKLRRFDWQQPVSLYSAELDDVQQVRRELSWGFQALDYPVAFSVVFLIVLGGLIWGIAMLLTWPFRSPRRVHR
jgi:hypothetical protein